jgi:hypothetical protein
METMQCKSGTLEIVRDLVKRSLGKKVRGKDNIIFRIKLFAELLDGDQKAGWMLNQVIYWSDRTNDPDGWFWKTYADWYDEIGLTEREIRRIVRGDKRRKTPKKTLQDLGIEVSVRRAQTGSPTMHYRINQPLFFAILVDHLERNHGLAFGENQLSSGQDENPAKVGLETDHCAAKNLPSSLEDSKIISSDSQKESSSATEDKAAIDIPSDQRRRFGQMNSHYEAKVHQQITRLGRTRAQEVIVRCIAKGGRSWSYVLKALENEPNTLEKAADCQITDLRTSKYADFIDFGDEGQADILRAPEEAQRRRIKSPIQPTMRVKTGWETADGNRTVQDAWNLTCSRMERILDRATFDTMVGGSTLADFDPSTKTFIVVLDNLQAYGKRYQIHFNTIYHILLTVYGDPKADVRFLTRADWLLRAGAVPTRQNAQQSACV